MVMDAAVIAALVATPTAVLAAGASYAGAYLQSRGALHGPVDAIRRQHQREAYAELLTSTKAYARTTLQLALSTQWEHLDDDAAESQMKAAAQPHRDALHMAVSAVELEGPGHVAAVVRRIEDRADAISRGLTGYVLSCADGVSPQELQTEQTRCFDSIKALHAAATAFTETARAHLNGTSTQTR